VQVKPNDTAPASSARAGWRRFGPPSPRQLPSRSRT